MKILLHIGLHKTGSSVLQRVLYEYKKQLARERLGVLQIPFVSRDIERWDSIDDNRNSDYREDIKNQIKQYKYKNIDSFILSFESLSGNPLRGYFNSKIIAHSLKTIFRDYEVKIIIYLRRQDDFLESLYTQTIHQGGFQTFDEFYNKYDEKLNWYKLLHGLSTVFGADSLYVRMYSDKLLKTKESLFVDFGEAIGSKHFYKYGEQLLTDQKKLGRFQNIGYSPSAIEIARIVNRELSKDDRSELRKLLQVTNSKAVLGNYYYLSDTQRMTLLADYEESNKQVMQHYFKASTDDYFSFDKRENLEINQELNIESLTLVMVKVLLYINQRNQTSHIVNGLKCVENFCIKNIHQFYRYLRSK